MTKSQLIAALEPYGDDTFLFVVLHGADPDGGVHQVGIQGVKAYRPWYSPIVPEDERGPNVGLLAHAGNAEVARPINTGPFLDGWRIAGPPMVMREGDHFVAEWPVVKAPPSES